MIFFKDGTIPIPTMCDLHRLAAAVDLKLGPTNAETALNGVHTKIRVSGGPC